MGKNVWLDVNGDWGNVNNWSLGAVPVSTDDVYILAGAQQIITNLNQSAVTLNSLSIGMGFTGQIGTSAAYLQISATSFNYGMPQNSSQTGTGPNRVKINFGTNVFTGVVLNTCQSSADTNLESLRILGTNASNKLTVNSGLVGVGTTTPSETSTLTELDVSGGQCNLGYGVTWATINVSSNGKVVTQSPTGTELSVSSGAQATVYGASSASGITQADIGGTAYFNHRPGSGNIVGTLNLLGTGVADFTGNAGSGTVGTMKHYKGGVWRNNPSNPTHVSATTYTPVGGGTRTVS